MVQKMIRNKSKKGVINGKVKNVIDKSHLDRYLNITKKAIDMVKSTEMDKKRMSEALDFLDMAERYYNDAIFFYSKGDFINAFAAVNYAHGWLDAGARIGLFKVKDSKLFTVDDE